MLTLLTKLLVIYYIHKIAHLLVLPRKAIWNRWRLPYIPTMVQGGKNEGLWDAHPLMTHLCHTSCLQGSGCIAEQGTQRLWKPEVGDYSGILFSNYLSAGAHTWTHSSCGNMPKTCASSSQTRVPTQRKEVSTKSCVRQRLQLYV